MSLAITAVANTAANRRLTFGVRGRDDLMRHHLGGLAMFARVGRNDRRRPGAAACTAIPHPSRVLELTVLLLASFCATATRYIGFSDLAVLPPP